MAGLMMAAFAATAGEVASNEITLSGKLAKEGTKYVLITKDGVKVALPQDKTPAMGKAAEDAKKLESAMRKLIDKEVTLVGKGQIKQAGDSRSIEVLSITSVSASGEAAPKKAKKPAPKPKDDDDMDDDTMDDMD
ncbi:MAG: hypothetical protein ABR497_06305 [Kiritimatiellia bacterium]